MNEFGQMVPEKVKPDVNYDNDMLDKSESEKQLRLVNTGKKWYMYEELEQF